MTERPLICVCDFCAICPLLPLVFAPACVRFAFGMCVCEHDHVERRVRVADAAAVIVSHKL